MEAFHFRPHRENPFPARRVKRNVDRVLEQVFEHVVHRCLALLRIGEHPRLLQHRVKLRRSEPPIGTGRMPERIEDVGVVPGPGHHIHASFPGWRFVLLPHAGVHRADVHDFDLGLDADLGELRLEDFGQLFPVAAGPHEHRRSRGLSGP